MPVLQNAPNAPTVNNTTAPNLTEFEEAKLLEGRKNNFRLKKNFFFRKLNNSSMGW